MSFSYIPIDDFARLCIIGYLLFVRCSCVWARNVIVVPNQLELLNNVGIRVHLVRGAHQERENLLVCVAFYYPLANEKPDFGLEPGLLTTVSFKRSVSVGSFFSNVSTLRSRSSKQSPDLNSSVA